MVQINPTRRARQLQQFNTKPTPIPLDQILAVQGQNPIAQGIDTGTKALVDAIRKRQELKRQAQVIKTMAAAAGETPPTETEGFTPDVYNDVLKLKTDRSAKISTAAKDRVGLEMGLEKLRAGSTERDPITGKDVIYPGVKDFNIDYDKEGNPFVVRGPAYAPKTEPKMGGGSGKAGRNQQVGVTAEGYTISFNPDRKVNEVSRPNGKGGFTVEPYFGSAFSKTTSPGELRTMGLAQIGRDSFNDVKATLANNPSVLSEAKAIKYSPGKVYGQFASPEAKQLFTNIQNILQAETYATTGAAMSIPELEQKSLMFMIKLNDSPQDTINRLGITVRNLNSLAPRQSPGENPGLQELPSPGGDEVERVTKDGRTAIFNAKTKQFLRYK